jgi:hypothetical protein
MKGNVYTCYKDDAVEVYPVSIKERWNERWYDIDPEQDWALFWLYSQKTRQNQHGLSFTMKIPMILYKSHLHRLPSGEAGMCL